MSTSYYHVMNKNIIEKFCYAFVLLTIFGLIGCQTLVVSPPQVNKFSGLIDETKLKVGANYLNNVNTKTLAIIYSANVPLQLKANTELMNRFDGTDLYYATFANTAVVKDDSLIVMSSDRLLDGILSPLKEKFGKVINANDIPDAFKRGADYVGIFDLRLEYLVNDGLRSELNVTHIANTSIVFINKQLEKGPEIAGLITLKQKTIAAGADKNNRDFLLHVKDARTQMIKDFKTDLNAKVLK